MSYILFEYASLLVVDLKYALYADLLTLAFFFRA